MTLEHIYKVLVDRGETELLFHLTQGIQQRDRLLWGVNSRSAELETLKQEQALLRERYRLLEAKHSQLVAINREHLEALRLARKELGKS